MGKIILYPNRKFIKKKVIRYKMEAGEESYFQIPLKARVRLIKLLTDDWRKSLRQSFNLRFTDEYE